MVFRALVIVLPCYGALEIVGVIIIIIIIPWHAMHFMNDMAANK